MLSCDILHNEEHLNLFNQHPVFKWLCPFWVCNCTTYGEEHHYDSFYAPVKKKICFLGLEWVSLQMLFPLRGIKE